MLLKSIFLLPLLAISAIAAPGAEPLDARDVIRHSDAANSANIKAAERIINAANTINSNIAQIKNNRGQFSGAAARQMDAILQQLSGATRKVKDGGNDLKSLLRKSGSSYNEAERLNGNRFGS